MTEEGRERYCIGEVNRVWTTTGREGHPVELGARIVMNWRTASVLDEGMQAAETAGSNCWLFSRMRLLVRC